MSGQLPAGDRDTLSTRALIAVLVAAAIPTVDATAGVVAVPTVARELGAGWLGQQWLLNAAPLALASLLLPAGMAGDRYGGGRLLRVGLSLIVVGSLVSTAAQHIGQLIAARAVVGAGGACLLPTTIAVVRSGTSATSSRTYGFGQLAGWVGLGSALSPLLAGLLIDVASWRAVFVIPGALAVIALALSPTLPQDREGSAPPRGLVFGVLAGGIGLAALTYAAIDAGAFGVTALRSGGALAIAAAALMLSVVTLHRQPDAAGLSRNWLAGNALTFVLYFALIGLSYLLITHAQDLAGWSATRAATTMLPPTLAMWLLSPRFGAATHRFGTRTVMTAAAALAGGGLLWTGLALDDTWSWWDMAPAGTVFGVGLACGAAPLTQAAVTSVSSARAGLAAAFNHAVVRAAGLAATIWLGSVASGGTATMTTEGVRTALFISAAVAGLGGLSLVLLFKEREPGGVAPAAEHA